jgi:hypothetical protein
MSFNRDSFPAAANARRARLGLAVLVLGLVAGSAGAADDGQRELGLANIRALAGCHAVTYRFYEDGRSDSFSGKSGLAKPIEELVRIDAETPDSVTLAHASVSAKGDVVPHWHEVWRYDERAGGWTQSVWSRAPTSPKRELRYACSAPWAGNLWECHAGKAPKPFRDDGAPFGFKRTDYDWLDRFNSVLVTERGWIQNERNRKVASDGSVVSRELGWIVYERTAPEQCAARKE